MTTVFVILVIIIALAIIFLVIVLNNIEKNKPAKLEIEKERAFPDMPWSDQKSPDKPASEWAESVDDPDLSEYLIKEYGDKYMTGSQFDAVLRGYYKEAPQN